MRVSRELGSCAPLGLFGVREPPLARWMAADEAPACVACVLRASIRPADRGSAARVSPDASAVRRRSLPAACSTSRLHRTTARASPSPLSLASADERAELLLVGRSGARRRAQPVGGGVRAGGGAPLTQVAGERAHAQARPCLVPRSHEERGEPRLHSLNSRTTPRTRTCPRIRAARRKLAQQGGGSYLAFCVVEDGWMMQQ